MQEALTASKDEQQQAIKQGGAVFAFTLKNGATTDSWYIDLKKSGTVGKGLVTPDGQKAQGTTTDTV